MHCKQAPLSLLPDPAASLQHSHTHTHQSTCASLDDCSWARALLKSDGVAHLFSQPHIHLFCDSPRHTHGCHSPWLRAHHLFAALAVARLSNELSNLRRFAAPRFSHKDNRLAAVHHLDEIIFGLPHRKPYTNKERRERTQNRGWQKAWAMNTLCHRRTSGQATDACGHGPLSPWRVDRIW